MPPIAPVCTCDTAVLEAPSRSRRSALSASFPVVPRRLGGTYRAAVGLICSDLRAPTRVFAATTYEQYFFHSTMVCRLLAGISQSLLTAGCNRDGPASHPHRSLSAPLSALRRRSSTAMQGGRGVPAQAVLSMQQDKVGMKPTDVSRPCSANLHGLLLVQGDCHPPSHATLQAEWLFGKLGTHARIAGATLLVRRFASQPDPFCSVVLPIAAVIHLLHFIPLRTHRQQSPAITLPTCSSKILLKTTALGARWWCTQHPARLPPLPFQRWSLPCPSSAPTPRPCKSLSGTTWMTGWVPGSSTCSRDTGEQAAAGLQSSRDAREQAAAAPT